MNRFKTHRLTKPAGLKVSSLSSHKQPTPLTPATMLLLAKALQDRQAGKPVLYYIATDKVADATQVYRLPDDRSAAGFDIAFHPDLLQAVTKQMADYYDLWPLDADEIARRAKEPVQEEAHGLLSQEDIH